MEMEARDQWKIEKSTSSHSDWRDKKNTYNNIGRGEYFRRNLLKGKKTVAVTVFPIDILNNAYYIPFETFLLYLLYNECFIYKISEEYFIGFALTRFYHVFFLLTRLTLLYCLHSIRLTNTSFQLPKENDCDEDFVNLEKSKYSEGLQEKKCLVDFVLV